VFKCEIKNYFEMILKSFQCFISHVTTSGTSETEIKLSKPLKLSVLKVFQNYLSDIEHVGKYSRAAIML